MSAKCANKNLESPIPPGVEIGEPPPSNGGKFSGAKENEGSHLPGVDEVQGLQGVGQPEVGQSLQLSSELQPGLSFGSSYQAYGAMK